MRYLVFVLLLILPGCYFFDSPIEVPGEAPVERPEFAITITFDDGWESVFTLAYPILQSRNLPANVGLITGTFRGNFEGYLKKYQIALLSDAGWTMLSHSVTHPDLTTLDQEALLQELRESREHIKQRGWTFADVFLIPYLSFDDEVMRAVRSEYFMARCCAIANIHGHELAFMDSLPQFNIAGVDVDWHPYHFREAAGRENLRYLLEVAKGEGRFVDIVFHNVFYEDMEAFAETVDILAEYRDYIVTYSELEEIVRATY